MGDDAPTRETRLSCNTVVKYICFFKTGLRLFRDNLKGVILQKEFLAALSWKVTVVKIHLSKASWGISHTVTGVRAETHHVIKLVIASLLFILKPQSNCHSKIPQVSTEYIQEILPLNFRPPF